MSGIRFDMVLLEQLLGLTDNRRGISNASPLSAELLDRALRGRLLATYLSGRAGSGAVNEPALNGYLRMVADRNERYRKLADALGAQVGSVRILKSETLAHNYPAGWIRESTDLDVQVADHGALLAAGAVLVRSGWRPTRYCVVGSGETWRAGIDFMRGTDPATGRDDWVQLQSFTSAGVPGDIAARVAEDSVDRLGPDQRTIVEICTGAVRRGRALARDVLDFAVLSSGSTASDLLDEAMSRMGLWPEWYLIDERVRALLGTNGQAPRLRSDRERQAWQLRTAQRVALIRSRTASEALCTGIAVECPQVDHCRSEAGIDLHRSADGTLTLVTPFGGGIVHIGESRPTEGRKTDGVLAQRHR